MQRFIVSRFGWSFPALSELVISVVAPGAADPRLLAAPVSGSTGFDRND